MDAFGGDCVALGDAVGDQGEVPVEDVQQVRVTSGEGGHECRQLGSDLGLGEGEYA